MCCIISLYQSKTRLVMVTQIIFIPNFLICVQFHAIRSQRSGHSRSEPNLSFFLSFNFQWSPTSTRGTRTLFSFKTGRRFIKYQPDHLHSRLQPRLFVKSSCWFHYSGPISGNHHPLGRPVSIGNLRGVLKNFSD